MSGNLIDLETLNELKEIMVDDFEGLINTYISDGQAQLEKLRIAIDSSSASDVRTIAHTLKGSSSNLGINHLSDICRTLELNAAENLLDDANELFEKISNEFKEVEKTLEQLI